MSPSKFLEQMIEAERLYQAGEISRADRNMKVTIYLALDAENVQREQAMTQAVNYAAA
jgi:hypothetical protein